MQLISPFPNIIYPLLPYTLLPSPLVGEGDRVRVNYFSLTPFFLLTFPPKITILQIAFPVYGGEDKRGFYQKREGKNQG
jgi:hypothetical protein